MEGYVSDLPGDEPLKNLKQERFCQEYLLTANGTLAAIRAGYSGSTAAQAASRMLRIVKVSERIDYLRHQDAVRLNLRKDRVLRELADIGMVNIGRILEIVERTERKADPVTREVTERAVQEIRLKDIPDDVWPAIQSISKNRYGLHIKLHDKLHALELIAKIMGWLVIRSDNSADKEDEMPKTADEIREFLGTLPAPIEVKPMTGYYSDH
ncbi:terminase small subunit [bacterium]|nr:terminase small subunit [bacterium]